MKNTRTLAICFIAIGTILTVLGLSLAITHMAVNSRSVTLREANRVHAAQIRTHNDAVAANTLAYQNYRAALNTMISWANGLSDTTTPTLATVFPAVAGANPLTSAEVRTREVGIARDYIGQLATLRRYGQVHGAETVFRPTFMNSSANQTHAGVVLSRPTWSVQNRDAERAARNDIDRVRQNAVRTNSGGQNFVSAFNASGTLTGLTGTAIIFLGGVALLVIGVIKLPKKQATA